MNALGDRLYEHGFESLFDRLDVSLERSGKRYVGPCPIHEGDNRNAIQFYPDGDEARGIWVCCTGHCHYAFRKSPVGFTRGVISRRKYGWSGIDDKGHVASIPETVHYLLDFLGLREDDIRPDVAKIARHRMASLADHWNRKPPEGKPLCDRDRFRAVVELPSPYYLCRGYSREILDTFDVGDCRDPRSPMCGRAVVPLYDQGHRNVIGVIGRSTHPRCDRCRYYHPETSPCPVNDRERLSCFKWICSRGFVDKHYLYNYWNVGKHVQKCRTLVVAEGPGDVWRLAEAGIPAVATMGCDLTESQAVTLQCSGARHVVLVRDMDVAGMGLVEVLREECRRTAAFHVLELPAKDVGEMAVDQVRDLVIPFLETHTPFRS